MAGGKEFVQLVVAGVVSGVLIAISSVAGVFFAVIGFVGLGLVGLGFYLFPAIVGWEREHPNQTSIVVLNLLLGWTLIGWVVAMVWAVSAIPEAPPSTPINNPPPWDARPEPQTASSTLDEKACPFCAEMVKHAAIKCKHCGSEIPA